MNFKKSHKTRISTRSLKQKARNLKQKSRRITRRIKNKKGGKTHKNHKKHTKKMRGGSSCGMRPLIGSPYNAADVSPSGNYLPYNPKVEAWPEQSNAIFNMQGGKNKKRQKGGGFLSTLLPDELINVGRSIPSSIGQMYDRFNGAESTASSYVYPTNQQYAKFATVQNMLPKTDLLKMYNNNNNIVSRI